MHKGMKIGVPVFHLRLAISVNSMYTWARGWEKDVDGIAGRNWLAGLLARHARSQYP